MPHPALLAVSHGTGNRSGQQAVARLVEAVAQRLPGVDVRLAHVDVQEPDVAEALAELSGPVVIVPLLLSAGYHVHVDLRRASAGRDDVTLAPALGPDPRLAEVLAQRLAQRLGAAGTPAGTVVLAVAGSSDERANDDCRITAELLSTRLGRPVELGFLAAAEPRLSTAVERVCASGTATAVATYLLAPGYFHDLALRQAGDAIVSGPLLDGDDPAPELVDLVVERFMTASEAM